MKSMWTASVTGLLVLVLASCGGSGGSGATGGGNAGQGGSGSVQVPPKLTINAEHYSSSCSKRREPLAGLTVLLHKDDGKILQTYQTAADGKLSVDWPGDARHVTLVHRNSAGKYSLSSFYDLRYTDLGNVSFTEPALTGRCGCRQFKLDWQDIRTSMPEYRLEYSSEREGTGFLPVRKDNNNLVNICPALANQFGKLQLLLIAGKQSPSYLSEVDLDALAGKTELQVKMSDFRQAGRLVNVSTDAGFGDLLFSSRVYGNYGAMMRLEQPGLSSGEPVRVFDLPGLKAAVRVQRNRDMGNISYSSLQVKMVPESSKSVTITPPDNLAVIAGKLQTIVNASETASTVDYDFGGIGPYQAMAITMYSNDFDWYYNGPLQGKIVELQLPEAISKVYDSTDFTLVDVFLEGIKGASDNRSFLQLSAEQSRDPSLMLKHPAFEESYFEWLTIYL